jgi:hypothetical protein
MFSDPAEVAPFGTDPSQLYPNTMFLVSILHMDLRSGQNIFGRFFVKLPKKFIILGSVFMNSGYNVFRQYIIVVELGTDKCSFKCKI